MARSVRAKPKITLLQEEDESHHILAATLCATLLSCDYSMTFRPAENCIDDPMLACAKQQRTISSRSCSLARALCYFGTTALSAPECLTSLDEAARQRHISSTRPSIARHQISSVPARLKLLPCAVADDTSVQITESESNAIASAAPGFALCDHDGSVELPYQCTRCRNRSAAALTCRTSFL